MKNYKRIIILVNLILFLGFFGYSLFKKETLLSEGKLVLLELAPVDPRSLMQGDYMELRYDITTKFNTDTIAKRGFCVIQLNNNNVGVNPRLQSASTPLNKGEYLIKYTSNNRRINIGSESFFFQEGKAKIYEKGKYGALRIDNKGNSLLVGLYNDKFEEIN